MAKSSRGGRRHGTGVNMANVHNVQNLISQRERKQTEVDETLTVLRDMYNEYGVSVDTFTADLTNRDANTLAFCDSSGNITVNNTYFNKRAMDGAMRDSAEDGFHPSLGDKSGIEAVVSHEFGHSLTFKLAEKLSKTEGRQLTIDDVSARIVTEARRSTGDRGNIIFGSKISKYATYSNAETIAEAISDVYCNKSKATAQSRAIKQVLNKYLKS